MRIKLATTCLITALFAFCDPVIATESNDERSVDEYLDQFTVDVGFIILRSTRSYQEALVFADEAAKKLGIHLDLRGLTYDPAHGLTWPKEKCTNPLYPFPFYLARGRFDAGVYVSIESSDAYTGFAEGYFLVIAASGPPNSSDSKQVLTNAREFYPDAYSKVAPVYHGCMH